LVVAPISAEELPVRGLGLPEVHGEVPLGAGGILEELRAAEMRMPLEKLDPGSRGPIGFFEAIFISRLDFKLPEDYKHRCPISCSRSAASQDNFSGEVWCAGR
jgi:hypothetical protein